jgi:NAD(P)-dependent dehydrogenase (short-subunit alcohol dehydrogenase family)
MLQAKSIVISGANSGIGKATALALAKQGHHIIMVCRSEQRGTKAVDEIISHCSHASLDLFLGDLSNQASIEACGAAIRSKYDSIDVLINNAGAIFGQHQLQSSGLENTFCLNHMGYFLLTHQLLPLLQTGTGKRIVNVASIAHKFVRKIPWGDLQLQHLRYTQMKAYSLSKLYNIYFTRILAKQLAADQITVNCFHPGTIYSGFGASGTSFFAKLVKVGGPLLSKPSLGAKTAVFLALSAKVAHQSGVYFAHRRKAHSSKLSKDLHQAQRLWDKSIELAEIDKYGQV